MADAPTRLTFAARIARARASLLETAVRLFQWIRGRSTARPSALLQRLTLAAWKARAQDQLLAGAVRLRIWIDKGKANSVSTFLYTAGLYPLFEAAQASPAAVFGVLTAIGGEYLCGRIEDALHRGEGAADVAAQAQADPQLRDALDELLARFEAVETLQARMPADDQDWLRATLREEFERLGNLGRYQTLLVGTFQGPVAHGEGAQALQGGQVIGHAEQVMIINNPPAAGADTGDTAGDATDALPAAPPKALAAAPPLSPDAARRRYLTELRRQCRFLPLSPLDVAEPGSHGLTLDDVYVELYVRPEGDGRMGGEKPFAISQREIRIEGEPPEQKEPPLARSVVVGPERLVVLLGDPGAGKSAFVRQLLAGQALRLLDADTSETNTSTEATADLDADLDADLIPVYIELRHFAPVLAALPPDERRGGSRQAQQNRLAYAVRDYVLGQLTEVAEGRVVSFTDALRETFEAGRVFLVCDGLDEVPEADRAQVRAAVEAVTERFALSKVLVTCRIRSYGGKTRLRKGPAYTLAPFGPDQIEAFCTSWYQAQTPQPFSATEADDQATELATVALAGDLRELAENPMLLTTMALVHQKEVGLPKERVKLYFLAVDVLLRRWQREKFADAMGVRQGAHAKALAAFLIEDLHVRGAMAVLAFEAHRAGQGRAADLERKEAFDTLRQYLWYQDYKEPDGLAGAFLDYVDRRAGLLLGMGGEEGQPDTYRFPHRTFQEYMAGCYLADQDDVEAAIRACADDGDTWALAVELAAEELYYNRSSSGRSSLRATMKALGGGDPDDEREARAVLWAGKMAALIGRVVIERAPGGGGSSFLRAFVPRVERLLGGTEQVCLPAVERAEAGRVLARLGDPRPEVTTLDAMPFCYVPGGPFEMGSEEGGDNEKPRHTVDLPGGFWMARYPVTAAQYADFVDAGGYAEEALWTEAKTAGLWEEGRLTRPTYLRFDGGRLTEVEGFAETPGDWDRQRDAANHPVYGVSWYEALAFARWLDRRYRATGGLPEGWALGLPSEAEWEKAARGGHTIPEAPLVRDLQAVLGRPEPPVVQIENDDAARQYPWGREPDADRANYHDTGIGSPSAVGCFPRGASPYGVEELSGNVWEWTRSLWGSDYDKSDFPYPYQPGGERERLDASPSIGRVLRGGAFGRADYDCRCAARHGSLPGYRSVSRGFRVVLHPLVI